MIAAEEKASRRSWNWHQEFGSGAGSGLGQDGVGFCGRKESEKVEG